ncbi:hypothetical protein PR202_ga21656 [Eleusine coracana subsp. coracana]|uniref:Uncharacterized protein n=1 Tax=Eleusine coracana subsp. coracana TaxID=191504 RepID=A0AAV5D0K0_ELECO|nr:hypothetical protein QOZ80_8AG0639010 [Eleusine coracana subsp. coracana]GJN04134.1 hypothetical protein PR202_ga21656 [Eleusine coracana subsp. coracana]
MAAGAAAPSIPDNLVPDILLRLPAQYFKKFVSDVNHSSSGVRPWLLALLPSASPTTSSPRSSSASPPLPSSAPAPSASSGATSSTTPASSSNTTAAARPRCFRRDDPPPLPDQTTTTSPRKFRVRLDAVDLRAGETSPIFSFAAPARRDHWRWDPRLIDYTPGSHHERERLVFKDDGAFAVHGSCAGVLLVSYKSATYLVNPARRRWSRTQSGAGGDGVLGFYPHRPSGEFRVLCHVAKSCRRPAPNSGGSSAGPLTQQLMGAVPMRIESPPALVACNLHWLRQGGGDILVFDTVAETARLMRPPPPVVVGHVAAQTLLEIDGKLTMTTVTRGIVNQLTAAELWVLRDYEGDDDSWARQLGPVPLPADEMARLGGGAVAVVSMEGDVVVRCAECVLQCDATGRVRGRYPMEGCRFVGVPHLFKESLVPHAHVDGREVRTGYESIQSPPFFLDIYQDDG